MLGAYEDFLSLYEARSPRPRLEKDKDVLFTLISQPPTGDTSVPPIPLNPAPFGTRQTKGCGSRNATLMMVYKLTTQAQKHWQRLHSHKLIELVVQGVEFQDCHQHPQHLTISLPKAGAAISLSLSTTRPVARFAANSQKFSSHPRISCQNHLMMRRGTGLANR